MAEVAAGSICDCGVAVSVASVDADVEVPKGVESVAVEPVVLLSGAAAVVVDGVSELIESRGAWLSPQAVRNRVRNNDATMQLLGVDRMLCKLNVDGVARHTNGGIAALIFTPTNTRIGR